MKQNPTTGIEETAGDVNIEDIMRDIRAKILAKHLSIGSSSEPIVPTSGEHLPPEFYEHLYQAALAYGDMGVNMHVTKVDVPIVGSLIERLRGKLHELVLFYVNQIVLQQKEVNYHLLRALAIASEKLEEDSELV